MRTRIVLLIGLLVSSFGCRSQASNGGSQPVSEKTAAVDKTRAAQTIAARPGSPRDLTAGSHRDEVTATPRLEEFPALEFGEFFYGVYFNGSKVGWMRRSVELGEAVVFENEMFAELRGLGATREVRLEESRRYSRVGALESVSFSQKAENSAATIEGVVQGKTLKLVIEAGGNTSEQTIAVEETLNDFLATERLARHGKPGETATSRHFDASVQRTMVTEHTVIAREKRVFAGVETDTVEIKSTTPALGISETSQYDASGTVLELRIGGFFQARLEPPEVAKKLDYSHDILVAAVVKAPSPVATPEKLEALQLKVNGFSPSSLPPETPRQQVNWKGQSTTIMLSRDAAPNISWPIETLSAELVEYTEATPFIQVEDPGIQRTAREVVGDAEDVYAATSRLSEFVYRAVQDEYVPAYSNAKDTLESRRGDCTEHAILFVALARALKIPARVAVGIAYWPPGGGFGWHAWAEVNGGDGWYAIDPTWNQPIADVTHLKLAGGGPAEQARIVMMLGELDIVELSGS